MAGETIPTRSDAASLRYAGDGEEKSHLAQLMDKAVPVPLMTLHLETPKFLSTSQGGEMWSVAASDGAVSYTLGGQRRGEVWKPVYFCVTGLPADPAATFRAARERVLSVVLRGRTDGVEVSAMPQLATSGRLLLETWGGRDIGAPWDNFWVFMVDDVPLANWGHPCRYIFVASDLSSVAVQYALTPLAVRSRSLLDAGGEAPFQVIIPFVREGGLDGIKKREPALSRKAMSCEGRVSNCYAVIVSGGYNTGNNHIRYWGDAAYIYSTLTLKYGYPKTNVFALVSDGLDPAIDRSDGSNSPTDLDGDGLPDTYASATLENVTNVFVALQSTLQSNDQLFVFFTDHGSPGDGGEWSAVLNLWGAGVLRDTDLKALTEPIKCAIIFAMEQCYSGGFVDDLNQTNRAIATAAPNESSYAGDTYPWFDQWAYSLTAAMRGFYPQNEMPWIDADSCHADANEDGFVSFEEAAAYALAYKYPNDFPMYADHPAGLGKRMFLSMPAREALGVSELVMDPLPAILELDTPFPLRITARNVFGDVMTNYAGPAKLWADGGAIDQGLYVGTNTLEWEYPFRTSAMGARTQVIYPVALLGEACTLDHFAMEVVSPSSLRMSNWTIRLKHTALEAYPAAPQWESTGWTTVCVSNQAISATGWVTFVFNPPFEYDGLQNLMVDFSFNNDRYRECGTCRVSTSSNMVSICYASDNGFGDPLTWSNNVPPPARNNRFPNLRFGPPPIPVEVRLEPTNLTGFVDGVWTGRVTALTTNAGIFLCVSDATHAWRGRSDRISILEECFIHYVDAACAHPMAPYTSWANAATTIQDAVSVAREGHTVLVTNGTYSEGGVPAPGSALTNRVCVTNAITLRSVHGAEFTTIRGSGGSLGDAAVRGVFLANGAALVGFTIADGRTRADSSADGCGGGLFLAADTVARECVLINNQAYSYGGGAHLNYGGTLNNCLLRGNSADYCGGAGLNYGGTLNNCTVYGNTGAGSGAPEISGGVTLLGSGTLNNCIVWGNSSPVSTNIYNSGGTVRNTCAGDGITHGVNGNVIGNPAFRNAGAGNYRLLTGSPCVDTGANAYAPTNETPFDLLGHSRVINGVVDMGACEWQIPTCSVLGTNGEVIASGEEVSSAKGMDLGTNCPGVATTHILAITNNGDGVLTITGCATNGAGAASFRCSGIPSFVSPFSASNFMVTFVPVATGALAAAVVIANDSTNSSYTINLAGFSRPVYASTTNAGPHAGGNEVTVTLAFPATVTNVLVGTNRWPAVVSASGTNWFTIRLPGADEAGMVDFTLQSLEYGDITLAQVYTYHPAGVIGGLTSDQWSPVAPLPEARTYLAAVTYSNAIYVIGGYDAEWISQDTVFRFDGTNWTEETALPSPLSSLGAAVWEDAIYLAGSSATNVFRYDGSSWSEVAGLPTEPDMPLMAVFSNRLHVVSGYSYTNCLVYDGAVWREEAGLPENSDVYRPAGGVLGPYLFAAGGGSYGPSTNSYRFDGTAWTSVAGLPQARYTLGTAVWQDRIYAIGGYNSNYNTTTNVFLFDGTVWSEEAGLPVDLYACGAAVLNDKLYCVAGYSSFAGVLSNVYVFIRGAPYFGVSPSNGPATGGSEVTITGCNLGNGSDITNVTICGVSVTSLVSQSSTRIVVLTDASGVSVTGDVCVYSVSYGETVKSNAFAYIKIEALLTILTWPREAGQTVPEQGSYLVEIGTPAQVVTWAKAGYRFAHWAG
ncbi:MAG: IPT/TIG domain-containing protein, partial [Lentisphaerota bacterium]